MASTSTSTAQQPPTKPPEGAAAPAEEAVGSGGGGSGSGSGGRANSPPLPTRHTAQAPGPRASRFQDVLNSTLAHTLAKISWDNFAACYPTVAEHAPAALRAVQRQMVDRLGALCKKEFASILEARNVVSRLNELETLVIEAERRRDEAGMEGREEPPIPPHVLPPEAVLAAHLAPHLAQQQSQLNARLQTTQAHNARLFADIRRQRAEVESLVALLQKVLDDVDAANAALEEGEDANGGVGVAEDLARETRAVEAEMASVAATAAASVAAAAAAGGGR
ncbi:hypothetical protein SLS62_002618 [Diatrype stigma]|uniref:Uncharacterized protein n=1 Tax=Diatrype stigma TaxID=117547 RepID=A0AAN9YS36_9PEZI